MAFVAVCYAGKAGGEKGIAVVWKYVEACRRVD